MRNRKRVVVSFLLVACMLIGIGYAALTDVLDINGTVDVNQSAAEAAFDADIYFTDATPANTGDSAYISTDDPDMAGFSIASLSGKGDTASFTFTISNFGDLDATVTPTLASDGNTNPTYFKITSDWEGRAKRLEAGSTLTYTVTVELLETPTASIHGAFHIELRAVSDEITTTVAETTTADPAETTEPAES